MAGALPTSTHGEGMVRLKRSAMLWAMAVVVAVLATGCGGSSKSKGGSTTTPTAAGAKGGTLITLANAAPSGSPDPQVNYTLQEWQWLILTHDGLVGYKRRSEERRVGEECRSRWSPDH